MYIPCTTCLHITLAHPCSYYYLLSPQYTHCILLHILLFIFLIIFVFFTYIYVYPLVLCYIFCTVHWTDLTWLTFHYWLYSVQFSVLATLLTYPAQVGQRVFAFEAECNHLSRVQHLYFGNATGIRSNSFCQCQSVTLLCLLAAWRNYRPITFISRLCWKTKGNQIIKQ